ncbi:tRNA pseudouridine(55) synthase TruB [Corynebacterium terpenotabidum]|uniref:tRNA pseudouridine synthase B n=1 Tax=Corynebacterium terpenotabidum Y-11 TaxID=1200352 RepID=S4XH34_9CORY|nr:tRNA pseudouridine(55) synthase TruB [Corynebacterium terpenotabidum]AGP30960.1 tRNA pseudouridine synthase B [Corynebacterium terpenotabidum Y-11]
MPRTDPRPVLDRSGLVVVDKPAGMTSHDVVGRLRRLFHTRRVGHSGTLDPMATGVLVVGIERGTRFLAHVVTHDKRYAATVRLGASTLTDDAEGEVLTTADAGALALLDEEQVRNAFAAQVGEIMQRPSSVSSVKVNGRRAHELVREGVEVVLPERPVTVFSLEVDEVRLSPAGDDGTGTVEADIRVHCSSGTYIRSIARDVGEALGVGGHLTALRRTSAGPFSIEEARTLDQLAEQSEQEEREGQVGQPTAVAAPPLSLTLDEAMVRCFPVREVTEDQGSALALGKWLEPVGADGVRAAVTPSGQAVALIEEKGKRAASVFVARPAGME